MTPELRVEQATTDDLPTVLEILDDAASWLQGKGIDQWPDSFTGDDTWRTERIRAYVENGNTYLVIDQSGKPVATFSLTLGADPQFAHGWPDGPDQGGYVFRMAVRRAASGNSIGAKILDWAGSEVNRNGRRWLRIDVHRFNIPLQEYYERLGFVKVAEVTAPDLSVPGRTRGSGALMQRSAFDGEAVLEHNRYDPNGTAAALLEAADMILGMRMANPPAFEDPWNAALTQAARTLATQASRIKQANGMYYRPIGEGDCDGKPADAG